MNSARSNITEQCGHDAAEDAFTSEGARPPSAPLERERQMADYGIGYDGLRYDYNGYRYDRLADAAEYASLMRSRPSQQDAGGPFVQRKAFAAPTDAQRTLMATLAIAFVDGAYRFDGYRYDNLADAVSYAQLTRRRQSDAA